MKLIATEIPDVLIIEPKIFGDERGFFFESFNRREFAKLAGLDLDFVQDNHSRSAKNVLRGLHYQIEQSQGKLVRVIEGSILDVVVDLRKSSKSFGKNVSIELSSENKRMLWIPKGFAHGFLVTSQTADVVYKTTDYFASQHERIVAWNDPALGINWNLSSPPILSSKDQNGTLLEKAAVFP